MNIITPEEDQALEAHFAEATDHRSPVGPLHDAGHPPPAIWKARRNLLAYSLMLDAGLRVGELVQLLTSDLFYLGKPVTTLTLRAPITKTKQQRSIPLSARILAYARLFYPQPALIPSAIDAPRLIARTPHGHALTTRQVERIIRRAARAAIGRPIHPHALRHTFATRLMKITDMRTTQELLGHTHLSSTQIYTHTNDHDKQQAIAALNPNPAPTQTAPTFPRLA